MTIKQIGRIKYGYLKEKCPTCGCEHNRKVEMEKVCSCGNIIKRTKDTFYNELPEACDECVEEYMKTVNKQEERIKYPGET